MKKLLSTAAICGLAMAATPAHAQVALELGGFMKGYGFYTDQDEDSAVAGESREFDIVRQTEVHFGGETTLDNGLTVGVHIESETDGDDAFAVEESYAYFSGGWGRVNFGAEDGANYLLQVEAPSADSNVDGIRQYVNPFNYDAAGAGAAGELGLAIDVNNTDGEIGNGGLDYDQDISGYADKLTYLSPIMNGFQLGASYTPDVADASDEDAENFDDVAQAFGEVYEAAVRYEGQFNNVGVILGAGFGHKELEETTAGSVAGDAGDDQTAWNLGADFDIGPFGIGASYGEDDFGETEDGAGGTREDQETLVLGVDYTTGPFKLGASYLDQDGTGNVAGDTGNDGVETQRYTGGVVYTYGPGMTFRGSISYVEHENVAGLTTGDDIDATSVLLGTQINF